MKYFLSFDECTPIFELSTFILRQISRINILEILKCVICPLSHVWMSFVCPFVSYSAIVYLRLKVFGTRHRAVGCWWNMPPPHSG